MINLPVIFRAGDFEPPKLSYIKAECKLIKKCGEYEGQKAFFSIKWTKKGQFYSNLQCVTLTCPAVTVLLCPQSWGPVADLWCQMWRDGDLQEQAQNPSSRCLGSWLTSTESSKRKNKGIKSFWHTQDISHKQGKEQRFFQFNFPSPICSLTSRCTKTSYNPAVCCQSRFSFKNLILCNVSRWPNPAV